MTRRSKVVAIAAALWIGGAGGVLAAPISIGGYVFDSAAFPTAAQYVSGGPPTFSSATGDLNADLLAAVNSDLATYVFGTPVTFNLLFGNAPVVNGVGADLVVFELGVPDTVTLSAEFGGAFTGPQVFATSFTGSQAAGFNLNAAAIDLSEFGVPLGDLVSLFQLNNTSTQTGSSSIVAVGALNTGTPPLPVPDPGSTLLLIGIGLAGVTTWRKRLR